MAVMTPKQEAERLAGMLTCTAGIAPTSINGNSYLNDKCREMIDAAAATIRAQAAEIARLSTPAGAAGVLLDQVMQKASYEAAGMREAMRDATLWAKVPSETRSQRWRYVGEALRALAGKETRP